MITFGKFGPTVDTKKEKELFLEILIEFIYKIEGYKERRNYNEKEIIEPVKKLLKENMKTSVDKLILSTFLFHFGLSYFILSEKEKEEILDMDYTYENWKIKVPELMLAFKERLQKVFPKLALFCLNDFYFILHIGMVSVEYYREDRFLIFIRNYYILDDTTWPVKEWRDQDKYKEIQKEVYAIYPILKEKYGMNRTLEKILGFFIFNDYSYEKSKKLLDDYYNKKKNNKNEYDDDEKINLKEKQD